ncbi:uncharacterized protein FA14DRAFT_143662 [Meira miltonrushii]|uniref:Nucleotide-sugar transporter n=1 Tax=Meira miltonrushii TaxID=1280837 RepID=A0A316VM09_9BASI|nr:uncharacterized protein FA14DRAFT_143662 [Meira miltonrushii]PWN38567.1 hypothetical protein FA14DRAFT_143662 [Meira miltonrushii]
MHISLPGVLLISLTLYRSTASNLLHLAGVQSHYSYSVAVLIGEFAKIAICFAVAVRQFDKTHLSGSNNRLQRYRRAGQRVWSETFTAQAWELLVPASLYVAQNNLCLYAAERLMPSIYQSIWQIRLLPTALLTGIFLKKYPSAQRWFCLWGIALGVIVIESAAISAKEGMKKSATITQNANADIVFGSLALLSASFCSAMSVVVLERIFKNGKSNFWVTNLQLSVFSLVPAYTLVLLDCWRAASIFAPFHAFFSGYWPWIAIVVQTGSGILAGLVTKYADGITNSISGVISIALTAFVDQILRSQDMTRASRITIMIGIGSVVACTYLYSVFPARGSPQMPHQPRKSSISLPRFHLSSTQKSGDRIRSAID